MRVYVIHSHLVKSPILRHIMSFPANLVLSSEFDTEGFRLIELPPHIWKELQISSLMESKVVLKGDADDNAVLCTQDATYSVKMSDTSNSVLLVPPTEGHDAMDFSSEHIRYVIGTATKSFEVAQSMPQFSKMKATLNKTIYRGEDEEKRIDAEDLLPFHRLLEHVQASEDEIRATLTRMHAFITKGCYRLMDAEYRQRVFELVLAEIALQRMPFDHVILSVIASSLAGHDIIPEVVDAVLRTYGDLSSLQTDNGEVAYALDTKRVCQYYAKVLLESSSGEWDYASFVREWEANVPHPMKPELDFLRGIALVHTTPLGAKTVKYFDEAELPEDPQVRFDTLFRIRSAWSVVDITPYLSGIASETITVEKLLFKYSRQYSHEGSKWCTRR